MSVSMASNSAATAASTVHRRKAIALAGQRVRFALLQQVELFIDLVQVVATTPAPGARSSAAGRVPRGIGDRRRRPVAAATTRTAPWTPARQRDPVLELLRRHRGDARLLRGRGGAGRPRIVVSTGGKLVEAARRAGCRSSACGDQPGPRSHTCSPPWPRWPRSRAAPGSGPRSTPPRPCSRRDRRRSQGVRDRRRLGGAGRSSTAAT